MHEKHGGESAALERWAIRAPYLLRIPNGCGHGHYYGGSQLWYPTRQTRISGCGPTAASNLLWYLAASRPESCAALFGGNARRQEEMLQLMTEVRQYVTPGIFGIARASRLAEGAVRLGAAKGTALRARVLTIPPRPLKRPSEEEVFAFLRAAFSRDLPVAFLNLSNGGLENLSRWHWVTLISVDSRLQAEMYDQTDRSVVDLAAWRARSFLGGGFVALEPDR